MERTVDAGSHTTAIDNTESARCMKSDHLIRQLHNFSFISTHSFGKVGYKIWYTNLTAKLFTFHDMQG